jgi:hypothetical protein
MENLNFVLKYKLASDRNFRAHAAARIKIDGRGGLIVYSENGMAEKITLSDLVAMSIQPAPLQAHA